MKVGTKAELKILYAQLELTARSLIGLIAGQEDKLGPIIAQELNTLSKLIDQSNFKEAWNMIKTFKGQLQDLERKGFKVKGVKSALLGLEEKYMEYKSS